MGKKHKHPEHENLERWLVSYADFMTLLFALFVVLYALSQADLAKFKQAGESIKQAFSNNARGITGQSDGIMQGQKDPKLLPKSGTSILDRFNPRPAPQPPTSQGSVNPVAESVKEINQEIQKMQGEGAGKGSGEGGSALGAAQLKLQERGIVISLSSNLFFEPGSAGIKPASFPVLDKVASELKPMDRIIHVEGHTDSQPVFTAFYPSNWELSAARASSVVRYFVNKHHFDPQALAAVGYADTRPLGDNHSSAGRAKNRRVDIVILFSSAVQEADAGEAQKSESPVVFSDESDPGGAIKISPSSQEGNPNPAQETSHGIQKAAITDTEEAGLPLPVKAAPTTTKPKSKPAPASLKPNVTKVTLPEKPKFIKTSQSTPNRPRVVLEEESAGTPKHTATKSSTVPKP